ncbi:BTAD domain-containing putative transcriptional regulator [Streptomyces sp. NPDC001941]|uniref:AfsR/SARP family transcriptional regulator n=1 Tax=Streptomyces sp. NPDC001941 TaxID=3154659 RepID=UPI0033208A21
MSAVRIAMLGSFEVRTGDGDEVEVPGARLRGLLAALAFEPGRIVQRATLVDWIWGEQPPADAVNALQVLVSRLRRVLPAGSVEAQAGGYRLIVGPEDVDVSRFEALVARARDAEDHLRADLLRSALELWRGSALDGIALQGNEAFDLAVSGLAERQLAVLGDRVDAEIRLGRGADLVSELTELVAKYPLREGFVAALMRALAAAGRGAEALTVYQQLRERLADELGVDPSAEISALHTALLRGDLGGRTENRRTNLRAELTTFVDGNGGNGGNGGYGENGKTGGGGGGDVVSAVAGLASLHRLVTLTGPGGSGKTRLARETARAMLGDLPDGAWLVELAPLRAGDELAQAVLTAIGLRDQSLHGGAGGGDPADRLVEAVRERAMVLVLDNCEHMIDAVSEFTDRLLGECRGLRVIATSREPLGITGEALWQVAPLALPGPGADPADAPAVRLLRDRADAVRRNIGTDERTLATMARVCRALDGMPLAIELAAARLRTMSVDQLADRLDDRFRLLTGGSRTALAHHQTLRAVVDWSWDLLSDEERDVLRRLSVFAGGAALEAAEQVCADSGGYVLDLLTALTEKSLLVADGEGAPRYRMLNTIREYAYQRLVEAGEAEAARRAHLAYFTGLAETAEPHLRRPEQLEWLEALDAENDNIRAALRGAIAGKRSREALRLVAALGWYWFLSGQKAEGTQLALAAAQLEGSEADGGDGEGAVDGPTRALAYAFVTLLVTSGFGTPEQAREWILKTHELPGDHHPVLRLVRPLERMPHGPEEFLAAYEALRTDDDPWVRAQARLNASRFQLALGLDEAGAEAGMAEALKEFRAIGERWGTSFALTTLAERLALRGEFAPACAHLEQAAAALTEVGATEDVVGVRARQAQLSWLLGDGPASEVALAEARRGADRVAWPDGLAQLAVAEAQLAYWRGRTDEAYEQLNTAAAQFGDEGGGSQCLVLDLYGYLAEDLDRSRAHRAEALAAAVRMAHRPWIAQVLVGVADLALRQDRAEQAARLLAAADALRGGPDRSLPDAGRIAREARERLGDEAFTEAAREGREEDWQELAGAVLKG